VTFRRSEGLFSQIPVGATVMQDRITEVEQVLLYATLRS
jgi:hypothetical protein